MDTTHCLVVRMSLRKKLEYFAYIASVFTFRLPEQKKEKQVSDAFSKSTGVYLWKAEVTRASALAQSRSGSLYLHFRKMNINNSKANDVYAAEAIFLRGEEKKE